MPGLGGRPFGTAQDLEPRFFPIANHNAAGKHDACGQQTRFLFQGQPQAGAPVFCRTFVSWNNSQVVPEFCKFEQFSRHAQILEGPRSADFQSAVSQDFQPASLGQAERARRCLCFADWKSAIQRVGNLRHLSCGVVGRCESGSRRRRMLPRDLRFA